MKPKVYIDGKEGTTGLQIYDRLASRSDIELLLIDEAKRKDYIEGILLSSNALLDLINDILDLSKLESGRVALANEPTDCAKLLSEIVDSFKIAQKKPGVELRCKAGGLPRALRPLHRTVKLDRGTDSLLEEREKRRNGIGGRMAIRRIVTLQVLLEHGSVPLF